MALCQGCAPIWAIKGQPVGNFTTWKNLGITHLFLNELQGGLYTQLQWRAAAASAGLKYIDYPSSNLAADAADPNLVAFVLAPQFPDRLGTSVSVWQAVNASIKAITNKPILGMFGGREVVRNYNTNPPYNGSVQKTFLPYADWAGNDLEPMNTDPAVYPVSMIGTAMTLLGSWANGGPQISTIETCNSNINANGRSPTTTEMRAEVDLVMANAASIGMIFDPIVVAGGATAFSFDGTNSGMKTAIQQAITAWTPTAVARVPKITLYTDFTWEFN